MRRLDWNVAAITDRGCKRSENQDNFYVSPDNRVFVVADGMGGERGGATASKLAVDAVAKLWEQRRPHATAKDEIQTWLADAVSSANASVWNTSCKDPAVHGMGTTIVMAVQSDDGNLYIAHVGDSRVYLVRDGEGKVLTQDHSVVMELLLQGKISPEQFRTSPFRSYITRCVGHNNKVEVDNTPAELRHGDRIILCTDGLTAVLKDEEIGDIASQFDTPDETCNQLLRETLAGGAPDNVTLVVVYYSEVPAEVPRSMPEQLAGKES